MWKELKNGWIKSHGAPVQLVSGRGSHNISAFFQRKCREQNNRQIFTSPYNPTSNSISERVNQTIAFQLRDQKGRKLEDVLRSLNATVNRTLGVTPEVLFLGFSRIYPTRFKQKST